MNEPQKKLLILDLDETLIHSTTEKLPGLVEDYRFDNYFVYKRPNLDRFLLEAYQHFILGVWSSAGDEYVQEIVRAIKPDNIDFAIVWGRKRCSVRIDRESDTYYFQKPLKKLKRLGYPLEQIIIVDDTESKAACNYGNAVYIREYQGEAEDGELLSLLKYLLTIKEAENVRVIEKRNWRRLCGT